MTPRITIPRRGAGLICRIYGDRPDFARRIVRRFYGEGKQLAFEYFENADTIRAELRALFRWLREEDE